MTYSLPNYMYNHLFTCKQITDVKLLVLHCNTWNHLTKKWVRARLTTLSPKCIYKYLIYTYKQDMALNNLHGLICHKPKHNYVVRYVYKELNIGDKAFISKDFIDRVNESIKFWVMEKPFNRELHWVKNYAKLRATKLSFSAFHGLLW